MLQDPLVLTNRKDSMPIKHWLVKMKGKMAANNDLYDTPAHHMVYVMNCVEGMAFGHLKLRFCDNATNSWKDLDEIFIYLKRVFGDLNRQKNAEKKF